MKIKTVDINNKIVLAPLAGYTDSTFRRIVKSFGVGLVFSEMISAKGLIYDNKKTSALTIVRPEEHPIAMQIFGGEVDALVQAGVILNRDSDCDIIDINMGCPVRKVLKANAGCMLLNDIQKIENIVKSIVAVVSKPVSVKIRAGWDHNNINCVAVAQAAERAGASLITIHGRTKSDLYRGKVNLNYIKAVKEAVGIPVIGNGDIQSLEDAIKMLNATGVNFLMVGRGALGNPWLIRDLVDYFAGKPLSPPPTVYEKIEMCLKHFTMLLADKPEKTAVMEMRSWAAWYLKGIKNGRLIRQKLMRIKERQELIAFLSKLNQGDIIS